MVDLLEVGAFKGTVDVAAPALAQQTTTASCKPGVYVYEGSGVTPDDMDGVTGRRHRSAGLPAPHARGTGGPGQLLVPVSGSRRLYRRRHVSGRRRR